MRFSVSSLAGFGFILILVLALFAFFHAHLKTSKTSGTLLSGEYTRNYEENLESSYTHRVFSLNTWSFLKYLFFKEGKEGVLVGQDGWIFTNEEFSYPVNYFKNIEDNFEYIDYVQKIISEQGAKLILLPIPSKAFLNQDKLGRYKLPQYRKNIHEKFISFLNGRGINHLDLLAVLDEQENKIFFIKNDTHWTPEASRKVALELSKYLKSLWPDIKLNHGIFESRITSTVQHEGDLLAFLPSEKGRLVTVNQWLTEEANNNDGLLFDDKDFDVVLIGTSYSANKKWNFDGFLKEYMNTDILNLSDEGLGPFEVMDNYLKDPKYKPKLIIWEIPQRYLPVFYNNNLSYD